MKTRRVLWIDASAGAAGDMLLGMWVDLGLPFARLRRALKTLPIEGWSVRSRRVVRAGLNARKIDVRTRTHAHGRRWRDLRAIVDAADLAPAVKERARAVFRRLVEAEARAHGGSPDRVHLHEAGDDDAILDVVGSCYGYHELGVERLVVSPLTTGFGRVRCAHGDYPVPGPATAILIEGVPVRGGELEAERLTPTGAAILTTLADGWGAAPAMVPTVCGMGAGARDDEHAPNVVRGLLGEEFAPLADADDVANEVVVIECALDDATPQQLAWTVERLLAEGALDATITPTVMKKGRPGHGLRVLARPRDADRLALVVLAETPTLGLRLRRERRIELERETHPVRTRFGAVRVKVGRLGGETLQAWPEYADCASAAARCGVPLAEVQQEALAAWRRASRGKRRGGSS